MKADTERSKRYHAALHTKKSFLHVHLSKDLRTKHKTRSMLVHKGDTVKVLRGPKQGTNAKVTKVSHIKSKVTVEGVTVKNRRGKEMPLLLQPSNLMITALAPRDQKGAEAPKAHVKVSPQNEVVVDQKK